MIGTINSRLRKFIGRNFIGDLVKKSGNDQDPSRPEFFKAESQWEPFPSGKENEENWIQDNQTQYEIENKQQLPKRSWYD
jgi:hypothetical protein